MVVSLTSYRCYGLGGVPADLEPTMTEISTRETIQPREAEASTRYLRAVWLGFAVTIVLYAVALFAIPLDRAMPPVEFSASARASVVVMALSSAGLSIWYRRRFTGRRRSLPYRTVHDATEPAIAVASEPVLTVAQEQIPTWAFVEAVALYGLVLAFPERDVVSYLPFGISALALMYYHRPGTWGAGSPPS